MEYLIYLGFFLFGWVLCTLNFRARLPSIVEDLTQVVASRAFEAGVQCGYTETLKQVGADSSDQIESRTVGFSVTPTTLNKSNGVSNDYNI